MNRDVKSLKLIIFLAFLTFFPNFIFSQSDVKRTTITIENALNTQYEKDKETGNDVVNLTGDVKISVVSGSNKNVISADSIRYDRTSEMMYASGNVSLEMTTESSGSQKVTADSLLFNTATLEGVFDDGRVVQTKSDAINLPSGSTLVVASDVFGRSESNTIAFKDGVLTFCDDEDPHWHIRASRIWLLPGGEFAFLNALLFVGVVPVFYFPAFYYPKDELIFNPVFGHESRKGYFNQNTFYLYGRKPLSSSTTSSSSDSEGEEKVKALFNFIKPSSLKEQKREGLILHNLDEDFKGDTSSYLKIFGDYYTNLGAMVGLSGTFKPKKIFSSFDGSLYLGFSNTLFESSSTYLPYTTSGKRIYEWSSFMGLTLPFRYGGNLEFAISKPFSLSVKIPIWSDPYFSDDFVTKREENMDWISYLMDQSKDKEKDVTQSTISSFTWSVNGSYSPTIPSFLKPYISSSSLSLSSQIQWTSTSASEDSLQYPVENYLDSRDVSSWRKNTPNKMFYYPSQVTPVKASASISGTLINLGSSSSSKSSSKTDVKYPSELKIPEELMSDKQKEDAVKALLSEEEKKVLAEKENAEKEAQKAEKENAVLPEDAFPKLSGISDSVTTIGGLNFTSKYSIKPSFDYQIAYNNSVLKTATDFSWDVQKSRYYIFKMPVTWDNSFSYGGNFLTVTNSNSYSPVWQYHPYIHRNAVDEETGKENETAWYSESSEKSLRKTDYSAQKQDITTTNSVSFKPLAYLPHFKDTGITYRQSLKVLRTVFDGDSYTQESDPSDCYDYNPIWEVFADDDEEEKSKSWTTHALDVTLAANEMDSKFTQSFTFTSTLWPQTEAYYGTLRFGFPNTSLTFETGEKKKTRDAAEFTKQPFKESFSITLFSNLKLSQSLSFVREETDTEGPHFDSLRFSASWKNLSVTYTQSYTTGYDFDNSEGSSTSRKWIARSSKEFLPYSLAFSYSLPTKTIYAWKNRVSLGTGFSTNLTADLLKPTSSSFTFSPSLSLKVQDFLTLTFSATSKNAAVYKYAFWFNPDSENNPYLPTAELNPFTDLWNSFMFGDESKRKSSSFKIKSMNFSLTHEMHDWNFSCSLKIEPKLITKDSKKTYTYDPYFSLSIIWNPMSAMKAEITKDYDEDWTQIKLN